VVKPDAVADADGVLGALPDATGPGSSAAAARASGLAALLRARHRDWPAATVRSALVTTARPLPGSSVLGQGAGTLGGDVPVTHLALTQGPRQWRRALETGSFRELNTTSLLLAARSPAVTRRVTNIGDRAEYFSVTATGFGPHRVTVRPLAVRLAPGESHRFTVTVSGPTGPSRLDDGYVVWRGARGGVTRIPVAITR
jgi:subtilisin family serine protease